MVHKWINVSNSSLLRLSLSTFLSPRCQDLVVRPNLGCHTCSAKHFALPRLQNTQLYLEACHITLLADADLGAAPFLASIGISTSPAVSATFCDHLFSTAILDMPSRESGVHVTSPIELSDTWHTGERHYTCTPFRPLEIHQATASSPPNGHSMNWWT